MDAMGFLPGPARFVYTYTMTYLDNGWEGPVGSFESWDAHYRYIASEFESSRHTTAELAEYQFTCMMYLYARRRSSVPIRGLQPVDATFSVFWEEQAQAPLEAGQLADPYLRFIALREAARLAEDGERKQQLVEKMRAAWDPALPEYVSVPWRVRRYLRGRKTKVSVTCAGCGVCTMFPLQCGRCKAHICCHACHRATYPMRKAQCLASAERLQ